jgi:hypothetical protein
MAFDDGDDDVGPAASSKAVQMFKYGWYAPHLAARTPSLALTAGSSLPKFKCKSGLQACWGRILASRPISSLHMAFSISAKTPGVGHNFSPGRMDMAANSRRARTLQEAAVCSRPPSGSQPTSEQRRKRAKVKEAMPMATFGCFENGGG